jgi:hypothetical protein
MLERRVRDFRLDSRLKASCQATILELCSDLGDVAVMESYDTSVANCLQVIDGITRRHVRLELAHNFLVGPLHAVGHSWCRQPGARIVLQRPCPMAFSSGQRALPMACSNLAHTTAGDAGRPCLFAEVSV